MNLKIIQPKKPNDSSSTVKRNPQSDPSQDTNTSFQNDKIASSYNEEMEQLSKKDDAIIAALQDLTNGQKEQTELLRKMNTKIDEVGEKSGQLFKSEVAEGITKKKGRIKKDF